MKSIGDACTAVLGFRLSLSPLRSNPDHNNSSSSVLSHAHQALKSLAGGLELRKPDARMMQELDTAVLALMTSRTKAAAAASWGKSCDGCCAPRAYGLLPDWLLSDMTHHMLVHKPNQRAGSKGSSALVSAAMGPQHRELFRHFEQVIV